MAGEFWLYDKEYSFDLKKIVERSRKGGEPAFNCVKFLMKRTRLMS